MSELASQQKPEFELGITYAPSIDEVASVFDNTPAEARELFVTSEMGRRQEKYQRLQQAFMHKVEVAELENHGRTDALTGLLNRRALEEHHDQLIHTRQREGKGRNDHVVIIDLDGFKNVNDTFGHPAGDTLLKAVAKRLQEAVRAEDVVARLGGDEFALLLVDPSFPNSAHEEDGLTVAERLLDTVVDASNCLNALYAVTASIGVGPLDPQRKFTETYQLVDDALYQAKRGGKAQIAHVTLPSQS